MTEIMRLYKNEKMYPSFAMLILAEDGVQYERKGPLFIIRNEENGIAAYHFDDEEKILSSYKDGYIPWNEELYAKVFAFFRKNGIELPERDNGNYFVVGKILSAQKHPESTHLHVCQVDIGGEIMQIVCGSKIIPIGQRVVVAQEKAVLPNGKLILNSKVNGVESKGMLCSAYELGLDPKKEKVGLLVIENQEIGTDFYLD